MKPKSQVTNSAKNNMAESTKTIAFRVSQEVEEQIDAMARAEGLSTGKWVRAKVMEVIHGVTEAGKAHTQETCPKPEADTTLINALELRLQELESTLRQVTNGNTPAAEEPTHRHEPSTVHPKNDTAAETSKQQPSRGRPIFVVAAELKIAALEFVKICPLAGVTGKQSALARLTEDEETRIKAFLSKPYARRNVAT